jgi:predicted N-acetyltransferase YhbS
MSAAPISYLPERPEDEAAIEAINQDAFGPGRFARAAFRIREGGPHDRRLSFVALSDGAVVGSVRQTWIAAGRGRAVLLGPLAVRPAFKNRGIGRELVRIALSAARDAGAPMVLLVGDEPYYGPLGFQVFPRGQARMPRPVDPERLLVALFDPAVLDAFAGEVVHAGHAGEEPGVSVPRDTMSSRAPAAAAQGR